MKMPAATVPQPGKSAKVLEKPVSAAPEFSDTLSQALYVLIAQQPFF
jgi:hypothetical protein